MTFQQDLDRLDTEDWHFLSGVIFARGKLYVGKTARGKGHRFSPMLAVELSMRLTPHFEALFDGPYERRYYGNEVLRYVIQDRQRLLIFCSALLPYTNRDLAGRVQQMIDFCAADSDEVRDKVYQQFVSS